MAALRCARSGRALQGAAVGAGWDEHVEILAILSFRLWSFPQNEPSFGTLESDIPAEGHTKQ